MSGSKKHMKSPWSTLSTIKTFDPGEENVENSFECQASDLGAKYGSLPRSFSSSMAIVCLVEKLCSFFEKDSARAQKLFEVLLKQLRSLGLIDDKVDSSEFEEMRDDFKTALCTMVSLSQKIIKIDSATSLQRIMRSFDEVDKPCRSRYVSDFDMLGFISRGGFGQVFRVRNRLDGCKYAIKKISVRSQDDLYQSILKEVTLLAKLQHPNIVKYYTAWLEPVSCDPVSSIRIVEEEEDESEASVQQDKHHWAYVETKHYVHKISNFSQRLATVEESSGSSYIKFQTDSQESGLQTSDSISKNDSEAKSSHCRGNAISESFSSSFSTGQAAIVPRKSDEREGPGRAVLYIQMELCGRSLRQWLDWRPVEADPSSMLGYLQLRTRLSCFWQLAAALEYLHGQGIIHHDIKPSNIFVFGNHRIKLGDFGLACTYENSKGMVHHDWGTCTYAAPEQLQGGLCDFKSDVYSTGLVLLELLMPPFITSAERIHVLTQLRENSIVPDSIAKQLPHWKKLLLQLTNFKPYERPSATEVKHKTELLICREPYSTQHFPESPVSPTFADKQNMKPQNPLQKNLLSQTNSQSSEANYPKSTFHVETHLNSEFRTLNGLSLEGSHKLLRSYLSYLETTHTQQTNGRTVNGTQNSYYDTIIYNLEKENQMLRDRVMQQEHQIKLLKEQVRLLGLQL